MDVIHTVIDMVYNPVATLYVILYENNIVNICSPQYVIFSLTNLVNNVPSNLLVDSICPFPWG